MLELDVDEGENGGNAEAMAQKGHDGSASGRSAGVDMLDGGSGCHDIARTSE